MTSISVGVEARVEHGHGQGSSTFIEHSRVGQDSPKLESPARQDGLAPSKTRRIDIHFGTGAGGGGSGETQPPLNQPHRAEESVLKRRVGLGHKGRN
jgi:hypothetical protein